MTTSNESGLVDLEADLQVNPSEGMRHHLPGESGTVHG